MNPLPDPLRINALLDCTLCPRNCHANRFLGKTGYCTSDAGYNIASVCIHRGEEPVISGPNGICNIFFTNCNLQCIYCQNHQISDVSIGRASTALSLDQAVKLIISILEKGIALVGFVSPSHFIPQMVEIIREVNLLGYRPKWVYNTNGYDKVESLKALEGIIDIYLPDFKYMDGTLAGRLSDAPDYPKVAAAALREMFRQKGATLHLNDEGTAESGLIIRHLVLPGATGNSLDVLRFIAHELSPRIHISLMSQYYPTARVSADPMLNREINQTEYNTVLQEMEKLGLDRGWVQEIESNAHYRPDFRNDHPFEP